jgi:hypothetical protein
MKRILKLGKITNNPKVGPRALLVSIFNPFSGWFKYSKSGYGRWLTLPGIKFMWVKKKNAGNIS